MKIFYLLFIIVLFVSCQSQTDYSMAIEKDNFHIMGEIGNLMPNSNAWYRSKEDSTVIDSVTLCDGEKSLRLVSYKRNNGKDCSRPIFYFDIAQLEGRMMTITGKYMAKMAEEAKIIFVLQKYPIGTNDTVVIHPLNKSQWTGFRMEHSLDSATTQLSFYIIPQGNLELYVGGFGT